MSSIFNWFSRTKNVSKRVNEHEKDIVITNNTKLSRTCIEYEFSNDERGRECQQLWSDSNDKLNEDIIQKRYEFLVKFYDSYNVFLGNKSYQQKLKECYVDSLSNVNSNSDIKATGIDDINDTVGHPSAVVMYIMITFINEVSFICNNQMSEANLCASQKDYFLLIIKCVDLLCYWPQNCAIINNNIGREVIESFNLIIKFTMEVFINKNNGSSSSKDSSFMFEILIRMLSMLSRLQEYGTSENIFKLENGKNESDIMTYNLPWDDKKLELYGFIMPSSKTDIKEYHNDREKHIRDGSYKEYTSKVNNNDDTISSKLLSLDCPQILLYLLDGINNQMDKIDSNESQCIQTWLILRIYVLHTILNSLHTSEAIKFGHRYSVDCPGSFGIMFKSYYQHSNQWTDNDNINQLLIVQFSLYLHLSQQFSVCRASIDQKLLTEAMGSYIQWGRRSCDNLPILELKNSKFEDCDIVTSVSFISSSSNLNLTCTTDDHYNIYKEFINKSKFKLCNRSIKFEDLRSLFGKSIDIWTFLFDFVLLQATSNNSDMLFNILVNFIKVGKLKIVNERIVFPVFQIFLVQYIQKYIINTPVQVVQEIRNTDLFSVLLGPYFLHGGHQELQDQVLSVESKNVNGYVCTEITSAKIIDVQGLSACMWSFLHDSLINLFEKIVETWFSQEISLLLSSTERSNEIVLIMKYLVTQVNKHETKTSEYSRVMFQLHQFFLSIVKKIADRKDAEYSLSEMLVYSIEVSSHFVTTLGIHDIKPSRVFASHESIYASDKFLLPAFYSATSVIMKIFESQPNKNIVWYYSLLDSNIYNPTENLINWRNPISDLSVNSTMITLGQVRMQIILQLLIHPTTRANSLIIISEIFDQSINDTLKMVRATDMHDLNSKRKHSLDALVFELLYGLLDVLSFTPKYPLWCKSYEAAVYILRCLNGFIYGQVPEKLQLKQNMFRQSDSISHLIFALVRCLKVPISKDFSTDFSSHILCHGIDLLTNIMSGNDLCKSDFRSILSANGRVDNIFVPGSTGVIQKLSKSVLNDPNVSYITFATTILESQSPPTFGVVLSLFLMILDKSSLAESNLAEASRFSSSRLFADDEDRPKILNPGAVPLLFLVLPRCTAEVQKIFFTSFGNLISGRASLINLNVCTTQAKVIDYVVDLFPYAVPEIQSILLNILKILGSHRIFVTQLKHLFSTLRSKDGCRPVYTASVLQALQGMIRTSYAPRYTFVFEGTNSGLRIPSISRWSAQKAFSFCTWLKVETPKRTKTSKGKLLEYQPYILSIRNEQFLGLDFYLINSSTPGEFRLVLRSYHETGENLIQGDLEDMVVRENTWHFISFSIFFPNILQKGWASIALDDKYVNYFVAFPKLTENIQSSLIGNSLDSEQKLASLINPIFQGQFGAVNFFSDVLSEQQLKGIYELGPEYYFCFDQNDKKFGEMSFLFDGTLKSLVMLSFNPMIWSQDLFLDATPDSNSNILKWRPKEKIITVSGQQYKMNAERLPGTFQSVTDDVLISLDALGGVKIFFPIIEQLNQQIYDIRSQEIVSTFDKSVLRTLIELILIVSERRSENERFLRKVNGFSFVVDICTAIHHYLDMETLEIWIKIYTRSVRTPQSNGRWLSLNFFEFFICNFKLWMFSSVSVHRRLLTWLNQELEFLCKHLPTSDMNRLREFLSPQKLIYSMLLLYDYEKPEMENRDLSFTVYFAESLTHPYTGEIIGQHLSQQEIKELRPLLFGSIKTFLTNYHSLLGEDISSIVIYSALTESIQSKHEALSFLLDFLTVDMKKTNQSLNVIIQGLANKQCMRILLLYLTHEDHNIRFLSMLLFCKILTLIPLFEGCGERPPKNKETFKIDENSDVYALLQALGIENNVQFNRILSYVEANMVKHVMSQDTLRDTHSKIILVAFQSIFLGDRENVFTTLPREMKSLSSTVSYAYNFDGPQKMCFPTMFKTILSFVNHDFISQDARLSLLVSLKLAVCNYSQVTDRIFTIDDWYSSLIQIIWRESDLLKTLSSPHLSKSTLEMKIIEKAQCVIDIAIRFLSETLEIAFRIGKPKYNVKAVFSQVEVCTDEEYLDAILIGDRFPGSVILLDILLFLHNEHYEEIYIKHSYDFKLEFTIYSALLFVLNQQLQAFLKKDQAAKSSSSTDLPFVSSFDLVEGLFYYNLWVISFSLVDFFQKLQVNSQFHVNLFWEVVNELLNLLEALEMIQPAWRIRYTDFDKDSNGSELRSTKYQSFWANRSTNTNFKSSDGSSPLKYSGGLPWLLIRSLTAAFELAVSLNLDDHSTKCTSSHIVSKLEMILTDSLKDFHMEKVWVLSKLHNILLMGNKEQDWVKKAITLFSRLLVEEIDSIILRLTNNNFYKEGLLSSNESTNKNTVLNLKEKWLELSFYTNHCLQDDSIENALFRGITKVIGHRLLATMKLSTELWNSFKVSNIEYVDKIFNNEQLKTQMSSMGLEVYRDFGCDLGKISVIEDLNLIDFHYDWDELENKLYSIRTLHFDRIGDFLKTIEIQKSRNQSKMTVICASVTNERGPWGAGAVSDQELFWKLDNVETSARTRLRLTRNPFGSRHERASQATKGSVIENETETSDNSSLKILMKYKNDGNTVSKIENELKDEDEENNYAEENDANNLTSDSDTIIFTSPVEVITYCSTTYGGRTQGTVEISKARFLFSKTSDFEINNSNPDVSWIQKPYPSTLWSTSDICSIYQRRYLHQWTAIEIFFSSRTSILLNLFNEKRAAQIYRVIRDNVKPPGLFFPPHRIRPALSMEKLGRQGSSTTLTQAWINREISNFEYIMTLNTTAGRSFNDLGQYPVFPWVLSDYVSNKIDLRDTAIYRDLKMPVGAQTATQREKCSKMYTNSLELYNQSSDEFPPFHHGSHYSTPAFVFGYLIRLEPFTSLHIGLQDGKFDKPDRLFHSIAATWKGCTSNSNDVRELVPEFYTCPEFLENLQAIDLGTMQNQVTIDGVALPPWCSNAHEFIQIHKAALESDYVSLNLHHWIDLIFGHKQDPLNQDAIDNFNVFFHLTYPNAMNLTQLKELDPALYLRTIRQIDGYGQMPNQLFKKPHPARKKFSELNITWPLASQILGVDTIPTDAPVPARPKSVVCYNEIKISNSTIRSCPILFLFVIGSLERLITVDSARVYGYHRFTMKHPDVVPPFTFKCAFSAESPYNSIGTPFASPGIFLEFLELKPSFPYKWIGSPENKKRMLREELKRLQSDSTSKTDSSMKSPITNETLSVRNTLTTRNSESISRVTKPDLEWIDNHLSTSLFAILPNLKLLFSCGHWDNAFKVSSVETGTLLQSVLHHYEVVTCIIAMSDYSHNWVITGSKDCTVVVWEIGIDKENPVNQNPLHILHGHDDAVICIAGNVELDTLVSGSRDGSIMVHSLRSGLYIRSISPSNLSNNIPNQSNAFMHTVNQVTQRRIINLLCISKHGYIITYSIHGNLLSTYSLNGRFIKMIDTGEKLNVMILSEDNTVLLTGGERCLVVLRWVNTLTLANTGSRYGLEAIIDGDNDEKGPFLTPIRSIHLTQFERHLIVGLESGHIRILAHDAEYLKQRLQSKLQFLGILG